MSFKVVDKLKSIGKWIADHKYWSATIVFLVIIVLVDEDIDAYLEGALEFYSNSEVLI